MSRLLFVLPRVASQEVVRLDLASGSVSPANVTSGGGGPAIEGSLVAAALDGSLPRVFGPNDGTSTLYVKRPGGAVVSVSGFAAPTEAAAPEAGAYVSYTGTAADPITDANAARPDVPGPVYWLCANGVDPLNKVGGDIVYNADPVTLHPANLHYAFADDNTFYTTPTGSAGGVVAYQIVGTPFVPEHPDWVELDAALTAGFHYAATAADGDGSVGQYVVFAVDPAPVGGVAAVDAVATNIGGVDYTLRQLWGFDPFDPAEQA